MRTSISSRPPRLDACNRQKEKGILASVQALIDKKPKLVGRYTDESSFFIARFSNTSDFLPQKKYAPSRAGRYPVEEISHEEDGSSDACNSDTSKRRVNLFLRRRRGSATDVRARPLQSELIRRFR